VPKFYVKTVVASFFLGVVTTLLFLQAIPIKLGVWALINLLTFIVLNEKMSIREKWTGKAKALMFVVFLSTTYLIFFSGLV